MNQSAVPASNLHSNVPDAVFYVTSVYLGIVAVFSFLANGTILVLYARCKTLHNPVNMFLVNVCVGDFFVATLGTPFTLAANVAKGWIFGDGGCIWYAFIVTTCGTEQIVSLAAVSMQRCCLVVRPFTAQKMTTRWAVFFIALTWIYSLIVSLPPAIGWNSYVLEGTGTACSVDWTSSDPADSSYIIFIFIMVLVIPLSLIVGSYTLLIYAVKKIASSEAARSSQHKADKKVTILVAIMISCFLVAWTPYTVFSLYVTASKNNTISPVAASIPAMFAKACTVYNPIVYFLLNKQFKDAFIDMFCCGRNPFSTENDDGRQVPAVPTARARQSVAPEPIRVRGRQGRQEISASMDTQMSELGATPAVSRRPGPIKTADWGPKDAPSTSKIDPPAQQQADTNRNEFTQTPVEAFDVTEEETDARAAKKEPTKKRSKVSIKSGKVCPVEEPDAAEA